MRGYVGNTDVGWYRFLRTRPDLDEVNFWFPSPGGLLRTEGTDKGTPFLFKLKQEFGNVVCGFGYLVEDMELPAWYAWETFGEKNGAATQNEMFSRIGQYRKAPAGTEFRSLDIGCLVIVQPTFFSQDQWVPAPEDWKKNVVRGAYYDLSVGVGARLWRDCQERAQALQVAPPLAASANKWGAPVSVRPRLGQGAFRVAVTKAYQSACAITREHSLPVVEAAHIRPYASEGVHSVSNGIALRSDLHRLFDRGYITFDEDHRIVVSKRLREDFENGVNYDRMQDEGKRLWIPQRAADRPVLKALEWHREATFLG